MEKSIVEKTEVLVCPHCSESNGSAHVIFMCFECEGRFEEGDIVICNQEILADAGRHFCKDCWEDKERKIRGF